VRPSTLGSLVKGLASFNISSRALCKRPGVETGSEGSGASVCAEEVASVEGWNEEFDEEVPDAIEFGVARLGST
jgi:hypothetical protein